MGTLVQPVFEPRRAVRVVVGAALVVGSLAALVGLVGASTAGASQTTPAAPSSQITQLTLSQVSPSQDCGKAGCVTLVTVTGQKKRNMKKKKRN